MLAAGAAQGQLPQHGGRSVKAGPSSVRLPSYSHRQPAAFWDTELVRECQGCVVPRASSLLLRGRRHTPLPLISDLGPGHGVLCFSQC